LEQQELEHRRKAAAAIVRTLAENHDGEQLPLFTQRDGSHSAVQFGWDCQELVVRTGTRKSEQEKRDSLGDERSKIGHVLIEAKLNTSLDTVVRYQAAKKRDWYRPSTNFGLYSGRGARGRWQERRIKMISFTPSAASKTYQEERERGEEEVTSNESLQEHMSATQRALADAIERQQVGVEGLQAARFQLLKLFGRIERTPRANRQCLWWTGGFCPMCRRTARPTNAGSMPTSRTTERRLGGCRRP